MNSAATKAPVSMEIGKFIKLSVAVGSRVTCSPPPSDTDADFLCLVQSKDEAPMRAALLAEGYEQDGSFVSDAQNRRPADERFQSYKLGEINLILTPSFEFFWRFVAASSVAKRLNLLDKQDRIALFQAVLYGNGAERKDA